MARETAIMCYYLAKLRVYLSLLLLLQVIRVIHHLCFLGHSVHNFFTTIIMIIINVVKQIIQF